MCLFVWLVTSVMSKTFHALSATIVPYICVYIYIYIFILSYYMYIDLSVCSTINSLRQPLHRRNRLGCRSRWTFSWTCPTLVSSSKRSTSPSFHPDLSGPHSCTYETFENFNLWSESIIVCSFLCHFSQGLVTKPGSQSEAWSMQHPGWMFAYICNKQRKLVTCLIGLCRSLRQQREITLYVSKLFTVVIES